jgi:regulator of sirC expression with transglutaminase-like and TPR domain
MINASLGFPSIPSACPVELFESFRRNFQNIQTTEGLLTCALDIAKISFDDLNHAKIFQQLEEWVTQVRKSCSRPEPRALIAHLHEVLFEKAGFCGCDDKHYYYPINSYLNYVLEHKRGLPILLSLIYKVAAEKLGLRVEGVHTPGRFFIRVHDGFSWMVLDPYMQGRLLTAVEVSQLVSEITKNKFMYLDDSLPIATHAMWIERILTNLAYAFDLSGCSQDRDAMYELIYVVQSS